MVEKGRWRWVDGGWASMWHGSLSIWRYFAGGAVMVLIPVLLHALACDAMLCCRGSLV